MPEGRHSKKKTLTWQLRSSNNHRVIIPNNSPFFHPSLRITDSLTACLFSATSLYEAPGFSWNSRHIKFLVFPFDSTSSSIDDSRENQLSPLDNL